ncbi:hypothetical protein Tcan_10718 [Toxocara canis]|uniref:Pepsin inhibitor-3-like repeated domain-containing protein n=1 Tax=Toxocara canis TaxID=6265 RepID=A0A0B2VLQ7_TOXCA|nr:hypothetical protein Tcan_10718 [Toxocara canis]
MNTTGFFSWDRFLVASFVCASLALPLEPVDSEKTNIIEIDDFLERGCTVVNGTKLFFDETFIRDLSKDEQKQNEKYEKDLKAYNEHPLPLEAGFIKEAEGINLKGQFEKYGWKS